MLKCENCGNIELILSVFPIMRYICKNCGKIISLNDGNNIFSNVEMILYESSYDSNITDISNMFENVDKITFESEE